RGAGFERRCSVDVVQDGRWHVPCWLFGKLVEKMLTYRSWRRRILVHMPWWGFVPLARLHQLIAHIPELALGMTCLHWLRGGGGHAVVGSFVALACGGIAATEGPDRRALVCEDGELRLTEETCG